jgi:hypothetical protein
VFSRGKFPFPAREHLGIEAQIPGGFPHTVAVVGDQADRLALERRRLRLAFLCQHGTPPGSVVSLFPRCPFLLDHNKSCRPYQVLPT